MRLPSSLSISTKLYGIFTLLAMATIALAGIITATNLLALNAIVAAQDIRGQAEGFFQRLRAA